MIRKLSKNIIAIILVIILISISYKIGQWRTWRPKEKPETVFITDTLDYEYPDYVEKPRLFFRLFHESIPSRSIQPVTFKPWMDSIFTAIRIIKSGSNMKAMMKKGTIVHEFIVDNVPDDFEFYGTSIGYNLIKKRFKSPITWDKLTIGIKGYYDRDIAYYTETRLNIKQFSIALGVDNHSIYIEGSWKIW